jgi:hypothetical protein
MTSRTLQIDIVSFWHAGTGRGDGTGLDATVARTPSGLPEYRGRALKGLLREATHRAAELGWFPADPVQIDKWFGTDSLGRVKRLERSKVEDASAANAKAAPEPDGAKELEESRFGTTISQLLISSARLGQGDDRARWEAWAAANPESRDTLYGEIASTALKDGIALDRTLRVSEVCAPVTLYATLEGPPEALQAIEKALPLLRHLGSHRTRGLGRARFTLLAEAR